MAYTKKTVPLGPATDGTDDLSTQGTIGARVDAGDLDSDHKLPARSRDQGASEGADIQIDVGLDASDYFKADRDWLMWRNVLVNGNFDHAQRGASGSAVFTAASLWANSDDTYLLDQWLLLSDGNDRVDVSQVTDAPQGSALSVKFEAETLTAAPNSEKFGFCQPIPASVAKKLAGKKVSLSFWAKTQSGEVENLRAVILAWNSTADAITSDVVSAWNAEGSDPTWATNWTAENTPADLVLTNSWKQFTIENVNLDTASLANLAVFIWVDDTDLAADDVFWIAQAGLVVGPKAGEFQDRPDVDELARCQRHFFKTFNQNMAPAENTENSAGTVFATSAGTAANSINVSGVYAVRMHAAPSVVTYDPWFSGSGWSDGFANKVAAASTLGDRSCRLRNIGTISDGVMHNIHFTAEAVL